MPETNKVAVVSYDERYESGHTAGVFVDVDAARAWIEKNHPEYTLDPSGNFTYRADWSEYTIDLMEVQGRENADTEDDDFYRV